MALKFLIDCGIAATRGAVLTEDGLSHFWIGPPTEEMDRLLIPGQRVTGQIATIDQTRNMLWVTLANGETAMVPNTNEKEIPSVGAACELLIKAIYGGAKAHRADFFDSTHKEQESNYLRLPAHPAIVAWYVLKGLSGWTSDPVEVLITSGRGKAVLEQAVGKRGDASADSIPTITVTPTIFDDAAFDDILMETLTPTVNLGSGGRITICETEALTAIDIDSGRGDANSGLKLRERINKEAFDEILIQILRRGLSGQILIDFLGMKRAARDHFDGWIRKRLSEMGLKVSRYGWNAADILCFVRERKFPSLLEVWTEPGHVHPIAGRHYSTDFLTRRVLWLMEDALRARPATTITARISAKLYTHIHHASSGRLQQFSAQYGARVHLQQDDTLPDESVEFVET